MANSAQFLKEAKERPEKYYIVHYSSESLYDKTIEGNAPRITSIMVVHYATGQISSFAIDTVADILNIPKQNVVAQDDAIEAEMLRQFYDFAAPRAHLSWVHWNNLLFVDHVALMGLEITGFTRANLDTLWVDPYEYRNELSDAVSLLNSYGMNCSVYNHQICTINADVLINYRKSISDWKNEYLEACARCTQLDNCGGLFSSSKRHRHSDHIKAFA